MIFSYKPSIHILNKRTAYESQQSPWEKLSLLVAIKFKTIKHLLVKIFIFIYEQAVVVPSMEVS